jgi:hypothetical protein
MKTRNRSHHHQEGAALFVAVLILALMGAMGIMAFNTVLVDRQVAGFQNHSNTAFYAAEAAAARGRSLLRGVGSRSDLPSLPASTLGDAGLYDREPALPSYSGEGANPIRYIDEGGPAGGMGVDVGGQSFVYTLWQINVQGQSPNGSTARIEVVESKVLDQGY